MTRLAIFGAGGLGQLVHDIVRQHPEAQVVGFLDSDTALHKRTRDGLTVLGGLSAVERLRWAGLTHAIVAIGENRLRVQIAAALQERGLELASAIHPLASFARTSRLGAHVVVGPRATVCVHADIGEHCVISAGAIVEHDVRIGAGAFLHPAVRLAGGVHVGAGATLEIGASVIPGVRIGAGARVGAGSVVIRDVPSGARVSGVPAGPADEPAGSAGDVAVCAGDARTLHCR